MADSIGSLGWQGSASPDWLQQYTRGLASQAQAVGNEAYTPYTSPANAATYGTDSGRIAGFTPAQQQAQAGALANQGSYKPYVSAATDLLNQAGNTASAGGGWQSYLTSAAGTTKDAINAANAATKSYQPGFENAANTTNSAIQATGAVPGTYQGYLNAAGQTIPGVIDKYMNPYTDAVVNRIQQLGNRNLAENLMPSVNSTFAGAGQFGSTRSSDFTNKALRDTQDAILGQQSSALQTGYQNAAQNATSDLNRQLSLGQTAGQLGYQGASLLGNLGQNQANQAASLGQLGYQGAGLLGTLGLNQTNMGNMVGSLTTQDINNMLNVANGQAGMGSTIQNLSYKDLSMLDAAGLAQQQQQQKNMDLAYQDYLTQLNYPKTQIAFQRGVLSGLPQSSSNSYYGSSSPTTSANQLSPLMAAAQGFLGARTAYGS